MCGKLFIFKDISLLDSSYIIFTNKLYLWTVILTKLIMNLLQPHIILVAPILIELSSIMARRSGQPRPHGHMFLLKTNFVSFSSGGTYGRGVEFEIWILVYKVWKYLVGMFHVTNTLANYLSNVSSFLCFDFTKINLLWTDVKLSLQQDGKICYHEVAKICWALGCHPRDNDHVTH